MVSAVRGQGRDWRAIPPPKASTHPSPAVAQVLGVSPSCAPDLQSSVPFWLYPGVYQACTPAVPFQSKSPHARLLRL